MKRYRMLLGFTFSCAGLILVLAVSLLGNRLERATTPPFGFTSPYWELNVAALGSQPATGEEMYADLASGALAAPVAEMVLVSAGGSFLYYYNGAGPGAWPANAVMVRRGAVYERMVVNERLSLYGQSLAVHSYFESGHKLALYPDTMLVFSLAQAPSLDGTFYVQLQGASAEGVSKLESYFMQMGYSVGAARGQTGLSAAALAFVFLAKEGLVPTLVMLFTLYAVFATCKLFSLRHRRLMHIHRVYGALARQARWNLYRRVLWAVGSGTVAGAVLCMVFFRLWGAEINAGIVLFAALLSAFLLALTSLLAIPARVPGENEV